MKVLFVCLGNICRSPSAEGVFREISDCVSQKISSRSGQRHRAGAMVNQGNPQRRF